jgi:PAS domain S-box-containing protein
METGMFDARELIDRIAEGFGAVRLIGDPPVDFVWVAANPALATMMGRPLDEIVGAKGSERVTGDLARLVERFTDVTLTGEPVRFEHRFGEPETVWTVHAFVLGDGMLGMLHTDITDDRRAQAALHESEDHFRHTVELNPQVTWTAQPDGQLDQVASRWSEWTGTPGIGDSWAVALHTDDRKRSAIAWQHAVATGAPYDIEHRIRMVDGQYRWVRSRASARRDDTGAIVKWYGSTEDINDRAVAVAALAESEARFREIADQAPIPMWVTALDRTRAFVNKAYAEFLGTSEAEAKVFDWRTIIHPDDGPRILAESLSGEASLEPFTLEARYRGGDGEWTWLRSESNPRFDAAGNLAGFIGAAFDITIAKEAQLRLEELVAERTAELESAQAALRQSQKLESMGQLTGGVAHDFNNLLTPIVGTLDALQRRGFDDPRLERLIGGAQQSAERARLLVQRLLAFARRQPLRPVAVDLANLIDGMRDLLASTVGPRVTLKVDLEADLPCVIADPNQLEMAILNLGVNARDAMPNGGIIEVSATSLDHCACDGRVGERCVRLCIADTGMGMDEATRERAIEPFFSTKGVGRGTGLGLSMVHGLAAQQGGRLEIESAPGEGTRILLFLPSTSDSAATASATDDRKSSGAGRILLVDDEPLVRAATADMLAELGYHVAEAESAEAALLLLNAGTKVDALVTDHLMPGMSGTELALMAAARKPPLPALIISGFADTGDLAPAVPSLAKPFRRDDLAAALADLTAAD